MSKRKRITHSLNVRRIISKVKQQSRRWTINMVVIRQLEIRKEINKLSGMGMLAALLFISNSASAVNDEKMVEGFSLGVVMVSAILLLSYYLKSMEDE